MDNFPIFFDALLTSVANFLWMDATRWITASIILLFVITVIKRMIKL